MLITAIRLNQSQSKHFRYSKYLAGHYSYCLLTMQCNEGYQVCPWLSEIEPDIWDLGDIWHLRTENQKTMAKWKSRQNTENRGFHGFHGPIANYTAIGICSETITAPWHCDLRMALLHIGLVKHKEISFKVYTVYILLFILLLILSTVTIWWIGWSHDMYCDCECCVVLTRLIPSDRFRIHWPWSLNLLF